MGDFRLKDWTATIILGVALAIVLTVAAIMWSMSDPKPTAEMFTLLGGVVAVFSLHIGHVSGHRLGGQQVSPHLIGQGVVEAMKKEGWSPDRGVPGIEQ
jgi:hypothetical protein